MLLFCFDSFLVNKLFLTVFRNGWEFDFSVWQLENFSKQIDVLVKSNLPWMSKNKESSLSVFIFCLLLSSNQWRLLCPLASSFTSKSFILCLLLPCGWNCRNEKMGFIYLCELRNAPTSGLCECVILSINYEYGKKKITS